VTLSAFQPLPLGQRIPASEHAVSCSLPTMADVHGYEQKDPNTTRHLTSGYPRFVVHPLARELAGHFIAQSPGLRGRHLWLASSEGMAAALAAHLKSDGVAVFSADGVHGVSHRADDAELASRAKLFLQHLGGFISSREAEDALVRLGLRAHAEPDEGFPGDARGEVDRVLLPSLTGADPRDLFLANSGMNAVYAAFRAISELQAARGRTIWIQVGWLYLDSIALLKKFTGAPGDYLPLLDVFDHTAIEAAFAAHGSRIAGVISELPTNPLIQTPDVPRLSALCRSHGARLILDPSVVSVLSVDVLPHADVVVGSLTKYTASNGDVMAGFAAVNPAGPDAHELRRRIPAALEPVYPRDVSALAAQIGRTGSILARVSGSLPRVVEFLRGHPGVLEVFWTQHPKSRANYLRIARSPEADGAMISFTVRSPLDRFYDRLRLPKGPSFGMRTTLICPFMYLAHYDLVSTPGGRAELHRLGIDPDLLRLSIGTEPTEEIIAALSEALA
jgi:cystathionine gamma-synthase